MESPPLVQLIIKVKPSGGQAGNEQVYRVIFSSTRGRGRMEVISLLLLALALGIFFPLELPSIPRLGDCLLVFPGTSISWKAFQLRQFYTEQLLGTAGPASLLSVRNQLANVSVQDYHKQHADLIIHYSKKILSSRVCRVDPGKVNFIYLFIFNTRHIRKFLEDFEKSQRS